MTAEGNNNVKNIYARGADDGFLLGVYFVAMLLLSALGFKVPAVNLLASAMAVGRCCATSSCGVRSGRLTDC